MANTSEDGNHTTSNLMCKTGVYETHQKIFLSVLNSTVAITAFLGNVLIIVALQNVSSLHTPSKLLLRCLAITDLCVGLITQPLHVAFLTSPDHSERCYYLRFLFNSSGVIFVGVSLSTLTVISLDRLLALLLGLRYRQVVNLRRVQISLIVSWLSSLTVSMVFLYSFRITVSIVSLFILLCIAVSAVCYTKIYLTLRHHRTQVQNSIHQGQQNEAGTPLNIARYRKTVSSALLVQITLVACYLPYPIVYILAVSRLRIKFLGLVSEAAIFLMMVNSSINPFLYCWKMREVRQAVKDTIRQFFCSSS